VVQPEIKRGGEGSTGVRGLTESKYRGVHPAKRIGEQKWGRRGVLKAVLKLSERYKLDVRPEQWWVSRKKGGQGIGGALEDWLEKGDFYFLLKDAI